MNELYKKLVDVYVGGDLGSEVPSDLGSILEAEAAKDAEVAQDLASMQATYQELMDMPAPEFTEESYQRILLKVYTRGGELQTKTPVASHLQFHLPLQG